MNKTAVAIWALAIIALVVSGFAVVGFQRDSANVVAAKLAAERANQQAIADAQVKVLNDQLAIKAGEVQAAKDAAAKAEFDKASVVSQVNDLDSQVKDLQTRLDNVPVSVPAPVETPKFSGKEQDVAVSEGFATAFGSSITSIDVPFLKDDRLNIDVNGVSNEYRYHEELALTNGVSVQTGLSGFANSEDYKDNVFVPVLAGSIAYEFVFDGALKTGNFLSDATSNDPVNVVFLGKPMKIVGASASSLTVEVGDENFFNVNDMLTIGGKQVKLVNVASTGNTVVVEVDGVRATVKNTETVNGLRIQVQDTFSSNTLMERSATLIVGTSTTKTYNDGDAFIGEDKNSPAWVWSIQDANTDSPKIGVKWALNVDTVDETDNKGYPHVLYVGDNVSLPFGFATFKFAGLNQVDSAAYTVSSDIRDLYATNTATAPSVLSAKVLKATVAGTYNTGYRVDGQKASTIYLVEASDSSVSVYYKDANTGHAVFGHTIASGGVLFQLDYSKSLVDVKLNAPSLSAGGYLEFDFQTLDMLSVGLKSDGGVFKYVGLSDDDADAGLVANGVNVAGWDSDARMVSGVVLKHPGSEFQRQNGALKFSLPKDVSDFKAQIVIGQ
jgi:hypothetical protein